MSKGGSPSIPTDYTFTLEGSPQAIQVDSGLDNIKVTQIPKVYSSVAVTDIPKVYSSVAVTEIPKIYSSVAVTEIPTIKFALTEIPEQRVHLPSHYQVCFSLFGVELWSLSLCGETQAINEKYVPRRTEKTCD